MGAFSYGPSRPEPDNGFDKFQGRDYLSKYPKKMRRDFERWLRLFTGKHVKVFSLDTTSNRCPDCVNDFTGACTNSNCPTCNGTGYVNAYVEIADTYSLVNIGPAMDIATPFGNMENTRSGKDTAVFIGDIPIKDRDLVALVDTKDLYKIVDVEPQIVAMDNEVVTQIAEIAYLTPGSNEYKFVITW